ncbi:hypothetical protein FOZ63_006485, partial [Perkinsus olseni]
EQEKEPIAGLVPLIDQIVDFKEGGPPKNFPCLDMATSFHTFLRSRLLLLAAVLISSSHSAALRSAPVNADDLERGEFPIDGENSRTVFGYVQGPKDEHPRLTDVAHIQYSYGSPPSLKAALLRSFGTDIAKGFTDYLNDLLNARPGFACKMFSESYVDKRLRQGEVISGFTLPEGVGTRQ